MRVLYTDRIPIIVQKILNSNVPDIDKTKYLVPSQLTVAEFMLIIRQRIKLPPETAMFMFIEKTLPSVSSTIESLYEKYKDNDGFLYVCYGGENTFGW